MRDDVTYHELEAQMDIDNITDALICEIFSANTDYPQNDVSMWRPVSDDGRWRWILKDLDFVATKWPVTFNMFTYMFLTGSPDQEEYQLVVSKPNRMAANTLYRRMFQFTEFREQLTDRFAVYLGDFLKQSVFDTLIESMASDIQDEMGPTFEAYEKMKQSKPFSTFVEELKDYFEQRPSIVYEQMADCFDLGDVYPMTVGTSGQRTSINGITLTEGDFDGAFFSDRELNLYADAQGYVWRMNIQHSGTIKETIDFDSPEITVLLSDYCVEDGESLSVAFELIKKQESAVNVTRTDIEIIGIYNVNGMTIESLQKGVNILRYSNGTYRKLMVD